VSRFIGRSVHRFIVEQDQMAVTSLSEIEFHHIDVERPGLPDTGERIFRRVAGRSAMADA
jgi:hypothetical protein